MRYIISYMTPDDPYIQTFRSSNDDRMLYWINRNFECDFEDIEDAFEWIEGTDPMDYRYVAFTISDAKSGYDCIMGYHN